MTAKNKPLISVICLCYNHKQFVIEALESILKQTYRPLQVLIADDASTDGSKAQIDSFLEKISTGPSLTFEFVQNDKNLGNCQTFNKLLLVARGKYLIDFSTDDVLLPTAIANHVHFFEQQPSTVGMVYANAELIDENGHHLRYYYPQNQPDTKAQNLYALALRAGGLVCTVSSMFRTDLMKELGGYDATLAYEDYDFMLKMAQSSLLAYHHAVVIQYRQHPASLSKQFYTTRSKQLLGSTLRVLEKHMAFCMQSGHQEDWAQSVLFHYRFAHYVGEDVLAHNFAKLYGHTHSRMPFFEKCLHMAALLKLPIPAFYTFFRQLSGRV